MDTAEEIKNLRDEMGMNRKEFCEYFEIPYRTVTDWEAGKRNMPEYVYRLMRYKAGIEELINTQNNE
ncbi:Helix-turn-helix [Pseudobutyrivibrio ruminis]|uniref:Helix-turn-helix n=1 Tax=Pseudobutyrivibrio ruminis TaxID=46206 RepID=A0A1H7GRN5_9FIRM|nr:helix-turn-helix domain-containing protein [Pseudobutyrivibrio ruminis]SEK40694.1 Helix-turn-helix [Pseudobutyrivibrio ruminis]